MSTQNIVRICGNCVAGMLLMLMLAPVGTSQTASAQESQDVTSDKSIGELRKETESAEKDLFSIFNDINSDDDYDVKCKREKSLGSRRKEQVCTPKFARRMQSNASADLVGQGRWDAPSQPGSRLQEKKDLMRQEMTELLATNTEFSAAFNRFAAAKRAYEAKLHSK